MDTDTEMEVERERNDYADKAAEESWGTAK